VICKSREWGGHRPRWVASPEEGKKRFIDFRMSLSNMNFGSALQK